MAARKLISRKQIPLNISLNKLRCCHKLNGKANDCSSNAKWYKRFKIMREMTIDLTFPFARFSERSMFREKKIASEEIDNIQVKTTRRSSSDALQVFQSIFPISYSVAVGLKVNYFLLHCVKDMTRLTARRESTKWLVQEYHLE